MPAGILYLVATPIGNLKDITFRAVEILKMADVIACEDTRHSGQLLAHFDIRKPLQSYHDHSSSKKTESLVDQLLEGKNIALISDAGTPLVSDPGFPLVREAIRRGIPVESIPGPSALIQALVLSGFGGDSFIFYGFLPQKDKKRRDVLNAFKKSAENEQAPRVGIFYESPYRILKTLKDMSDIFAGLPIAVCREMTKKFEEIVRGTAAEALKHFSGKKILGEFAIVVKGAE